MMHTRYTLLAALATMTLLSISAAAQTTAVNKLAAANTSFGLKLFAQAAAKSDGKNIFLSPTSIAQALTLAYNGAGSQTQQAMARTLGLTGWNLAQVNQANLALRQELVHADPQVRLEIANALWANQGIQFSPGFLARLQHYYSAKAAALDFKSPMAAAAINRWVSDSTQGKITQLVNPADLAGAASAVLTNAVYFKGKWTTPFVKTATHNSDFMLGGGSKKQVPLMARTGSFSYLKTDDFQAVSLPYGTGHLSLYVFLPAPESNLSAFETKLTPANWQNWMTRFHPNQIMLRLPRFKAAYETHLKAPLTQLGMGIAFAPSRADFKAMGRHMDYIKDVKHKAVVEVNEEGTEAAAVTGVIMAPMAVMRVTEMIVNRPFFCAIRDNTTGTLLFIGAIANPE